MAARVLVFGSTGTAGHATTRALRDAGHDVTCYGRSDPAIDGVRFHPGAVTNPAQLATAFAQKSYDCVVSCLASRTGDPADARMIDRDAHLAILAAAKQADVQCFVLLSAICLQKPRLAFQHEKRAFETALADSGLTWSIVRPTAFFKSVCGQLDRLREGKPYLMFGDGTRTACKPISDGDLGRYIADCVTDPSRANRILPIGGPGPAVTPREMGAELFRLLGKPPRYRRVPLNLLASIETALRLGGRVLPPLAARAEFAAIGRYYATESMLLWDPAARRYDADATPETGTEHLFDFYARLVAGHADAPRGDHAVF